jgi:hypothetical protein
MTGEKAWHSVYSVAASQPAFSATVHNYLSKHCLKEFSNLEKYLSQNNLFFSEGLPGPVNIWFGK